MANSLTPGPLGSAGNEAKGWADTGLLGYGGASTPLQAKSPAPAPAKPPIVAAIELNIMQSCPQPSTWKGKPAAERAAAFNKPRHWYPSDLDFMAVSNNPETLKVYTVEGLYGAIMGAQAPIGRLNFFGHGMKGLLPMSSYFDQSLDVVFDDDDVFRFRAGPSSDDKAILVPSSTVWGPHGENKSIANPQGYTLNAIRGKFAENAKIWLYLCNSGAEVAMLQHCANTFGCTVCGFQNDIWYCTPDNFPKSRNHRLEILNSDDQLVQIGMIHPCTALIINYKGLDSDPMKISMSPK